ncbi:MAG TPA: hypothetical protein PKH53_06255, partial [Candidatus Saccharicenans sp.]|nr:hypothetical protein [Candidatus Saccharicenans sp.]
MKSWKEMAEKTGLSEDQLQKIETIILKDNYFPAESVRQEIETFCTGLGLPQQYFRTVPLETIARHIEALKAGQILAMVRGEKTLRIDLARESEEEALYLVEDNHFRALEIEERIEKKYPGFRIQSYRSTEKLHGLEYLRWYLVKKPGLPARGITAEETDLKKIADKEFVASISKEAFDHYQTLIKKNKGKESPLIEAVHVGKEKNLRITIICQSDSIPRFFINVSDVINSHGLVSKRKYLEPLANGQTIFTFYVDDITDEHKLGNLISDIGLIYVIP